MARRAQIIQPRSDLKRKAVNLTTGFDLRLTPELIKQLEDVVHKSRDGFTKDIGERLAAMRQLLAETGPEPEAQNVLVTSLYESSLAIKGAGGTIGYDLLTLIGKSLNDFVTGLKSLDDRQRPVVGLHIDALYVVLANRITGRGGVVEKAIVDAFVEARRKFRPDGSDGGSGDQQRDA